MQSGRHPRGPGVPVGSAICIFKCYHKLEGREVLMGANYNVVINFQLNSAFVLSFFLSFFIYFFLS